jgi:hypothetical protein
MAGGWEIQTAFLAASRKVQLVCGGVNDPGEGVDTGGGSGAWYQAIVRWVHCPVHSAAEDHAGLEPPNCIPQVFLAQIVVYRGEDVPAGTRQLLLLGAAELTEARVADTRLFFGMGRGG